MKSTSATLYRQRCNAPELVAGLRRLSCEKMRARSGLLCVCVVVVHAAAWGQAYDPLDLLHRVSANVAGKLGTSGAYRCSLTIERSQYLSGGGRGTCEGSGASQPETRLIETDRAKRDVAITAGSETYSWPGEDRFSSDDPYDLAGFGLQMSSYSEVLSAIFGSEAADFDWIGETEVEGRKLAEFGFEVPLERSKYVFRSGEDRFDTAYRGTFLADPATGDLVLLTIRTDGLPEKATACEASTTLSYGRDAGLPLPVSAERDTLHRDRIESRNRAVYSACRLFTEKPETPGAPAPLISFRKPDLPAGLKFRIRLEKTIDPEKASGGDRIKAVLETPIREQSSTEVLVPVGAQIIARIIRLERFPDTKGLGLEFRLEAVEKKGEMIPLRAVAGETIPFTAFEMSLADLKPLPPGDLRFSHGEPTPPPPPRKVGVPFLTGHFQDDPGIFVLQFGPVKPGFVIKAGIKTNWVTAGP